MQKSKMSIPYQVYSKYIQNFTKMHCIIFQAIVFVIKGTKRFNRDSFLIIFDNSLKDAKQSRSEIFVVLATVSYKEICLRNKAILNKWTIIDETHDNKKWLRIATVSSTSSVGQFARMLNFFG